MSKPTTENKRYVQRLGEIVNDRNTDALSEVLAEDFVYHLELEEIRGIDGYTEYLEGLYDAFPDMTVSFEEVVAEDDMIAVRYTGSGTHEGTYKGIEPTGEEVHITGQRMARVGADGIVEVWGNTSNLSLLIQLGVVDPPV